MEPTRIPFKIASAYAGCAKVDGLIVVSSESLALEYRVSDKWLGALKSGVIKRTVPYAALERAEYRMGFFKPSVLFTARSLDAFANLPCADPTFLRLLVPWRYRRAARSAAAEINLYILFNEPSRFRLPLYRLG